MAIPFFDPYRFKMVMAGERAGKSFQGGDYAVTKYEVQRLTSDRAQLIWLVGQDYISCMPEFNYMVESLIELGELIPPHVNVRDGGRDHCSFTCYADPGNSDSPIALRVETITGAKPSGIARVAPDGILGCEIAAWSQELFFRVLARLSERRGWFWGSGSFESDSDWLATMWHQWQYEADARSYDMPSWSNPHVYPLGEADPEIATLRARMPRNLFIQRIEGRPAPPQGQVYEEASAVLHIDSNLIYDDSWPIEVWIDPGYAGAYAVLGVQVRPGGPEVVDEIYVRGWTHHEVIEEMRRRPWGPHVKSGVIDTAARQHHADRSAMEVWRASGIKLRDKKVKLIDGIERVHALLRGDGTPEFPSAKIAAHCRGFLSELGLAQPPFPGGGPWLYKTDRDGIPVREMPELRNNHACSAFAYGAVDAYGYVKKHRYTGSVSAFGDHGPSWTDWVGRSTTDGAAVS